MRPYDLNWMKEKILKLPRLNWLYKFCCLFLLKDKLTYNDLFLILYGINKRHIGEKHAEEFALSHILYAYKFNNNKLPEDMMKDDK